jgi:hypothetical protein
LRASRLARIVLERIRISVFQTLKRGPSVQRLNVASAPFWIPYDSPKPQNFSGRIPEIPTWTDEQLVIAIEVVDRRELGLNLSAKGDQPDRHQAFLHACSAELVCRLERQGVGFAA